MLVNPSRRFQAAIALLMLLVFVLVYLSVLSTFRRDSQLNTDDTLFKLGDLAQAGVSLSCRLVSIEPNERQMTVRLELTPTGDYAAADGTLKLPLQIEADTVAGTTAFSFKAGQTPGSVEFSASLVGSSSGYPYDHQQGQIRVTVTSNGAPVPLVVGGNAQVSGLRCALGRNFDPTGKRELPQIGPGFFHVTIEINRSPTVQMFAVFVMTLQWLMAAGAWLVALEVVIGGRYPDAPMFSWMTAMLFALPPMRNIMVGVPPIGVYADYLAFLWCEAIIALSLTAVVLAWLVRRPNKGP